MIIGCVTKNLSIHYHSECGFFAGCENMLANFFNSDEFRSTHNVTFSYLESEIYTQGLRRRLNKELPVHKINFPVFTDYGKLPQSIPLLVRKLIMAGLRMIFNIPLIICQVFVLYRLFKKINPDILHINNGGYPATRSTLAAAIAGKLAGIPKILMVVNNMATNYRHYSRWFDFPIDRLVIHSVNVFITGSIVAATQLRMVLNLPIHKVRTIHNGIALRNFSTSAVLTRMRLGAGNFTGVLFGVVALMIPRKGHQVLLDAILKIALDKSLLGREFKILIEGNGPLRQELADFVAEKNLTSWVIFVGDEENVIDFMNALDVLILPSVRDEDFPNVILESMALGKPVIASRLAGTPEQVLDGVTGILVDPCDIEQLALAILQLIDDHGLRYSMGCKAKERFNTFFTSQIALSKYSKLYIELNEDRQ